MTARPNPGFHRFSVTQYHRMIETGVLTENDRVELLDGYLVEKMPHDPLHDGTVQKVNRRLVRAIPSGWEVRVQSSITLANSEPEPDVALVREDSSGYMTRHPQAADFGIVIEVSNSTLASDRSDKREIYAEDRIPIYWIVNLIDRQIEVFEQPSGPTANPAYSSSQAYKPGSSVPLVLDGNVVASIPVADLLP